jgi:hypothetical protein
MRRYKEILKFSDDNEYAHMGQKCYILAYFIS